MATKRIEKLRTNLFDTQPEICTDRARYYTESMKATEGQPIIIRRAQAFRNVLEKMTIYISEGELIVGNHAFKPRAAPVFPEYAIEWIEKEMDEFEKRPGDRFFVSEAAKRELKEIFKYWNGKTNLEQVEAMAPEMAVKAWHMGVINNEWVMEGGFGNLIADFDKLFKIGLNGYLKEAKDHLASLDFLNPDDVRKMNFLKAAIITIEAVINFARRYSAKLSELAKQESDPKRKAELEKMSKICSRVPANPPRTFWEALQSLWFVQLTIQIEGSGHSISIGRFDQYLYPFYEKDIAEGRITREDALELIEAFFVKCNEPNKIRKWTDTQFFRGYQMFQNLMIAGQKEDGVDATNELSWLVLDATAELKLFSPSVSLRYHKRLPDDFLLRSVEVMNIHRGGMPATYNDECIVPMLIYEGVKPEDAYNYSIVGCSESTIPGKWSFSSAKGCFFNMGKVLELALYGGLDPKTGERLCPGNGDITELKSFDEFWEAFKKQFKFYLDQHIMLDNLNELTHEELVPNAFVSAMVQDCIKRGKSLDEGGAVYDINGGPSIGIATVADSLAAIKKAVFEEKWITAAQLKHALETNFEDMSTNPSGEEIRQMLINKVPKYGNDDDYVDRLAADVIIYFASEYEQYKCLRYGRGPVGGNYRVSTSVVSSNVPFGMAVGATPDGRKDGMPLNNGVSPSNGREVKGPSAAIKSVTKLPYLHMGAGNIFNVKMNPKMFETSEGCVKLASLIRAFCDLKGYHIQFNIIDAATLKDAQKKPEEYRDLMVRVAGYSAYFTAIDSAIQDDIIARTEFVV